MEPNCSGNSPWVLRLAENIHHNMAIAEQIDVIVLKFRSAYIGLNRIKADSY